MDVDAVAWYLNMFEKYSYEFPFENVENFYVLKTWPTEVRMAMNEGSRQASI